MLAFDLTPEDMEQQVAELQVVSEHLTDLQRARFAALFDQLFRHYSRMTAAAAPPPAGDDGRQGLGLSARAVHGKSRIAGRISSAR
jgi:hypothetical protein